MGVTGALMAGAGLMSVVGNISQGVNERNQAEANAAMYDQQAAIYQMQANSVNTQKQILAGQYGTKQTQLRGKAINLAASQGLKISGSTAASISQSISELQLEQSYQQYNLDVEKAQYLANSQNALNAAESQRNKGRAAMRAGMLKAATSALSTGTDIYSNYFGGAGQSINGFGTTIKHYGSSLRSGWTKLSSGTRTITRGWANEGTIV